MISPRAWACLALSASLLLVSAVHADDKPSAGKIKPFHYTIKTGDTASKLAQRWGLPESLIAKPSQMLKIGDVITIPLAARERVRRGASLSVIGQKYGVTVETLAKFNHVPPPYNIKSGKVILVPALK